MLIKINILTLFLAENFNILLEAVFRMWQNWETSRKHVSAGNVFGNMFPRLTRVKLAVAGAAGQPLAEA